MHCSFSRCNYQFLKNLKHRLMYGHSTRTTEKCGVMVVRVLQHIHRSVIEHRLMQIGPIKINQVICVEQVICDRPLGRVILRNCGFSFPFLGPLSRQHAQDAVRITVMGGISAPASVSDLDHALP